MLYEVDVTTICCNGYWKYECA